jgi:hypothetical protein
MAEEEKLQKENKDKLNNTQTPKHEGRRKTSTRKTKIAELQLLKRLTEDTYTQLTTSISSTRDIYSHQALNSTPVSRH